MKDGSLYDKGLNVKFYDSLNTANAFFILIKSDFGKNFGFFLPGNFHRGDYMYLDKVLAFYWIYKDEELVTCTDSYFPMFTSNSD